MTADDKYSLLSTDNLTRPIQMELFPKTKSFLSPCFSIFEIALNFEHFQKKDDPHIWFISEITDSEKGWLDIRLKKPVSADHLTGNMVISFKHSCNLNESSVTIFSDHVEGKWVGKGLF